MRIGGATLALAAAAAVGTGLGQEGQAPQPLEVPAAWQLDIDVQIPRPIQVVLPGDATPTTFWYLLYTVTNRYRDPQTQRPTEQIFVPDLALYTDTGQLLRAGKKSPNVVYEAIKKRHNNPHLKDMVAITGKLLFGEDNAKDGVAIWPDFDPQAGAFDIFVGGLSGEILEVKLPKPIPRPRLDDAGKPLEDKDGKILMEEVSTLRLTKTVHLRYEIPGEARARGRAPVKLLSKKWIMR